MGDTVGRPETVKSIRKSRRVTTNTGRRLHHSWRYQTYGIRSSNPELLRLIAPTNQLASDPCRHSYFRMRVSRTFTTLAYPETAIFGMTATVTGRKAVRTVVSGVSLDSLSLNYRTETPLYRIASECDIASGRLHLINCVARRSSIRALDGFIRCCSVVLFPCL